MTLRDQAARADAADKYRVNSIVAGEKYLADRRAGEQALAAAEDARAAADRQSQLPVIVGDGGHVAPAVPGGNVTVARADQSAPDTRTTSAPSAPTPLAAANVAAWIADESRFDPQGVASLQREWGADLPANLGYVKSWLHTAFTPEQREQAEAANILSVPVIRFLASIAREAAHTAPTTGATTTMKGQPQMAGETMSRADAEKAFRAATKRGHDLKARGDHMGAREAFAERDRLAEALYPGSSEPTADNSGHKVG